MKHSNAWSVAAGAVSVGTRFECISSTSVLEVHVRSRLDERGTSASESNVKGLNEAPVDDGRTWDRTRDLPRVKRALSR